MAYQVNEDNVPYLRFTGPQRLDKTLHTLEGILKGVAADGVLHPKEIRALDRWLDDNREHEHRHPFSEISGALRTALADDTMTAEEVDDILWLCARFTTQNDYFDTITSDMQRLHGIMAGCILDGEISVDELCRLQDWMDEREHLRSYYPYDELQALILSVLRDKRIDEKEQKTLKHFFSEFLSYINHRTVTPLAQCADVRLVGVCAVNPDVTFSGKGFCFTGASKRASRAELSEVVNSHGGRVCLRVSGDVDYLIVGGNGNACWAFSCYGRKVEQAMKLRREGVRLLIVHECDFWDAVQ